MAKKAHETMFNFISHQGNVNKSMGEILLHTYQNEWPKRKKKTISNADYDEEQVKGQYNAGGTVKWNSHFKSQSGSFSEG